MIGPFGIPLNEAPYSMERLRMILHNDRLLLNPYSLSDAELLNYVKNLNFESNLRLIQGIVITFSEITEFHYHTTYEALPYSICGGPYSHSISLGSMKTYMTAEDSAQRAQTLLDGKKFHAHGRIEQLQGKSVFVTHVLAGRNHFGRSTAAYFMHTLKGDLERDAAMIRRTLCEAKIEMLERVIAYPHYRYYLSCQRGIIDFETPLRRMIAYIRNHIPSSENLQK